MRRCREWKEMSSTTTLLAITGWRGAVDHRFSAEDPPGISVLGK